jgi:hypothetical protein
MGLGCIHSLGQHQNPEVSSGFFIGRSAAKFYRKELDSIESTTYPKCTDSTKVVGSLRRAVRNPAYAGTPAALFFVFPFIVTFNVASMVLTS